MSELVLATYDGEETAGHVLGVLRANRDDVPGSLESAAIIRVAADGGFSVTATDHPGSGSTFWGVLWEAIFALVFMVPTPSTGYGANLGGLFGAIDRAGLDEDFRNRARAALGPSSSCLALFAINWNPALVLDQLYLHPEAMLHATLTPKQDAELVQEVGGTTPTTAADPTPTE